MTRSFLRWTPLAARLLASTLVFCPAFISAAKAAEITSLAWEAGDAAAVAIAIGGQAPHVVETLEDGKRLRLRFNDTKLAPAVADLDGRGDVKGVYPYPTDNGNAVTVDFLMAAAGHLDVQATATGYRVQALTGERMSPSVRSGDTANTSSVGTDKGNAIEDITYTALPGDRLQIRLKMRKTPVAPIAFTITNPPRISLDFADTAVAMQKKSIAIGTGAVANVTAVEAESRSRVVLTLVRPVAYSTHLEPDGISIMVDNPVATIGGTEKPKTTRFTGASKPGRYALKNIDFRRGPDGDAKVMIDLSDPTVGINIYEQAGEIIVDFLDTSVSKELQRRLDVVDFATPVTVIDTFALGKNARMVIKPHGRYEHLAYQAGNVFTVNVKPVVVKPGDEKKADEFGYTGERLSLNFQNIDVRAALQVIADFTNLNFVTSDTVRGSLTLRLKDVPWDQALDIIVNAKNLAVRKKGNVVIVAPADEVAAKEKAALEANKQSLDLEPLVSELIQINYSKAADIAALLKSVRAVAGSLPTVQQPYSNVNIAKIETESNSLLSTRGQVTIDVRTNSILIQDTAPKIREIRKLIAKLDQPVRQVLIEARLVEATDTFSRSLGVRFGVQNNVTAGGINVDQGATLVNNNGLNVNLPAFGATGNLALTIAKLGTASLLNLELSSLEARGSGKIISSPRLITASQKKARIEQGQEKSIATTTGGLQTKKAVLALDVTPQITPDDRLILDVEISKDNFLPGAGELLMNTKRMNTQVLLDNGETVVIGGIYEQNEVNTVNQIPMFGDIPVLGWLFKTKGVRDDKTELLIFLTPRILSPSLSLQ